MSWRFYSRSRFAKSSGIFPCFICFGTNTHMQVPNFVNMDQLQTAISTRNYNETLRVCEELELLVMNTEQYLSTAAPFLTDCRSERDRRGAMQYERSIRCSARRIPYFQWFVRTKSVYTHLLCIRRWRDISRNSARFLWKRILLAGQKNDEINAIWNVCTALWQRNYSQFYAAIDGYSWSPLLSSIIADIKGTHSLYTTWMLRLDLFGNKHVENRLCAEKSPISARQGVHQYPITRCRALLWTVRERFDFR